MLRSALLEQGSRENLEHKFSCLKKTAETSTPCHPHVHWNWGFYKHFPLSTLFFFFLCHIKKKKICFCPIFAFLKKLFTSIYSDLKRLSPDCRSILPIFFCCCCCSKDADENNEPLSIGCRGSWIGPSSWWHTHFHQTMKLLNPNHCTQPPWCLWSSRSQELARFSAPLVDGLTVECTRQELTLSQRLSQSLFRNIVLSLYNSLFGLQILSPLTASNQEVFWQTICCQL